MDNRSKKENLEDKLKDLDVEGEEQEEKVENEENEDIENDEEESKIEEDTDSSDENEGSNDKEDEESEEPKKEEEAQPSPDYKEKFTKSTQEAQVLTAKNKKIQESIETAALLEEPTNEELETYAKNLGKEFSTLTPFEQTLLKDNYRNNRRFQIIKDTADEGKRMNEWMEKVNDYLEDEKLDPQLEGREADFATFCSKPTRRGVDIEDLKAAFLQTNPVVKKVKMKGSLLATGGSGAHAPVKPGIDEDGAVNIRKMSQKDYKQALKSGKIKIDID